MYQSTNRFFPCLCAEYEPSFRETSCEASWPCWQLCHSGGVLLSFLSFAFGNWVCRKMWCKQDTHAFKLQSNYLLPYAHSWDWQVPRPRRAGRDLTAAEENSVVLFPGTGSPSELLSCHPWIPVFDLGLYAFPGSDILHLNKLASVCKVLSHFVQPQLTHGLTALAHNLVVFLEVWVRIMLLDLKTEPQVTDWNKRRRVTEDAAMDSATCDCGLSRLLGLGNLAHTPPTPCWHTAKSP